MKLVNERVSESERAPVRLFKTTEYETFIYFISCMTDIRRCRVEFGCMFVFLNFFLGGLGSVGG